MRIAYIVNQYPQISHSFIRREIHALERRGFEVIRVAFRGWQDELADADDRAERELTRYALRGGPSAIVIAGLRMILARPICFIRALGTSWRMGRCSDRSRIVHFIYLAEACRIAFWLTKARVEHVHAHFGTNSAEVAMLLGILGQYTWSFTVHGPEEFDKAPLIKLAEKIRGSTFVVAISSFGRGQMYRLVDYLNWQKIEVVRCGLDEKFKAELSIPPPSSNRLVCVGRLCGQKGQLLLIEAMARLVRIRPEAILVLAGDGELRKEIESQIANRGLMENVHITGWLSNDAVRKEILKSRALVLPSFAEGLPVVIMEAMALRRPVISTFVAGIPELVSSGEHGWLVPAGNVEALVDAMVQCLDAPAETMTRMGESAMKRVIVRHDVDIEASKLERLFLDACGHSR